MPGRERGEHPLVVILHRVRGDQHPVLRVVEQQADKAHAVAVGQGEVVGDMIARIAEACIQVGVELRIGYFGNVVQRDGIGAVVGDVPGHSDAIWSIMDTRNPGCQMPAIVAASSRTRTDQERLRSAFERCSSSWLGW